MRSTHMFIEEEKTSPLRQLAVFFWTLAVIGTTLLNIAFTLAPRAMTHLVQVLMA